MASKEEEYKELFLSEALGNYEELNKLFTDLEKNTSDKNAVDAIFRITHTLKGNAMGMGFTKIAEVGHKMEDVFGGVKSGEINLTDDLFNLLFKANDKLGELIEALKTGKDVKYISIKNKLALVLGEPTEDDPDEGSEDDVEVEDSHVSFSDTVQIPVRKLDALLNQVGELIIERDRLLAVNSERGYNTNEFSRLHRITSDLQYSVMDARLVQVGFLFNKFHRVIRDVASIEGKKVNLELEGTDVEIDRNILKIMSDSLIHMVRNSVSHGIEPGGDRLQLGKPEIGTVTLSAKNEKDSVIIEVSDDGKGIDKNIIRRKAIEKGVITEVQAQTMSEEEIVMCIFAPGFSSAEEVTAVSGRGVGMDVVKKATESIGGKLSVRTVLGEGSTMELTLPASMAVKGALLFELDQQEYAVGLAYTEAVVCLKKSDLHRVGHGIMAKYLDYSIGVVFLKDLFEINHVSDISKKGILHRAYDELGDDDILNIIIVSYGNKMIGLVVDKLLQQKEIVEKTIAKPLDDMPLIAGGTILGSGNVCLTIDVIAIADLLFKAGV